MAERQEHTPAEALPFDGLIVEVLRDAAAATRIEARAEVERAPDRVLLRDGRPVGTTGPDRLWSFDVIGDVSPPPETPGRLVTGPGADPLSVRVLATGDATVLLGVREELGPSVASATLSLSAGFVHARLADRLDALAFDGSTDPVLIEALVVPDPDGTDDLGPIPLPPDPDEEPEGEQDLAARLAIEPGLRFTWGPPGTGKTRVLAQAVAMAVARGDRVLVLAHANAAVDVAVARIADELEGTEALADGRVLRVGTPHLPAALDRHDVLPEHIVAERQPELAGRRRELVAERRAASDESRAVTTADQRRLLGPRVEAIRAELADLDRQADAATRVLVDGAAVVATTLAGATISDQLWDWPADIVVVDEASMAGLPYLLGLAGRGPSTLSFVGDFRQLPPIAVSPREEAQRWFGRDVFEMADVISAYEAGRRDARMAVLRTQHRMGEQICTTVNTFAYDGLLTTDPAARNRGIRVAERWPVPGAEVVIVDTSGLGAVCSGPADPSDRSRFNLLHAAMASTIALTLADGTATGSPVGLVSPYRSQVALLLATSRHQPAVTAATIHRFQGSERDAIVFDLVDASGAPGPSMLTGTNADLSRRLLNVAASRARGKLVIVADLEFLGAAHPRGSRSRRLVECARDSGAETVAARVLLDEVPPVRDGRPPVVSWASSWSGAVGPTLAGASASRVEVSLPDPAHGGPWLADLLATAGDGAVTLHGPAAVGPADGTAFAERNLTPRSAAPWMVVGDDTLVVGSHREDGPAARLHVPALVSAYRRLVRTDH